MKRHSSVTASGGLKPYLTTCGAVALSFGCAVGWGAFIMPDLWIADALAAESYLILSVWSIVGIVVFRSVFNRDRTGHLGTTTVAWLVLLFFIFFAGHMWNRQKTRNLTADVELQENYSEKGFDSIILKPVTVGTLGPLLVGLAERKN